MRGIITGDFNHPVSGEGVYDVASNSLTMLYKRLAEAVEELFDDYHDITNDQYTRALKSADGRILKLSRIDRTLDNLPATHLRDRHPSLRQLWPATTSTAISDHVPIIYSSGGRNVANRIKAPCVPLWLVKDGRFTTILGQIMSSRRNRPNPMLQHADDKQSLYQTALELRKVLHHDKVQTTDGKLAMAIQAARAHHKRDLTNLNQALRNYPHLLDYFQGPDLTQPERLHLRIQQLANSTRDQKLSELEQLQRQHEYHSNTTKQNDFDEQQIQQHKQNLLRWAKQFGLKNKTISIDTITHDDGTPYGTPEEEVNAIILEWQPTFSPPVLVPAATDFLSGFVTAIDFVIEWVISFVMFMQLVARTKDTAPGPDGICYGAWRAAHLPLVEHLYEFYKYSYHSIHYHLSYDFNFSNFACVPKHITDPSILRTATTPSNVRMLSVSNTDHKILAGAAAIPLSVLAQRTVIG